MLRTMPYVGVPVTSRQWLYNYSNGFPSSAASSINNCKELPKAFMNQLCLLMLNVSDKASAAHHEHVSGSSLSSFHIKLHVQVELFPEVAFAFLCLALLTCLFCLKNLAVFVSGCAASHKSMTTGTSTLCFLSVWQVMHFFMHFSLCCILLQYCS